MPNTIVSSSEYDEHIDLKQQWADLIDQEANSLNLSNRKITDEHIPVLLAFLKAHPEIRTLDLSCNLLSDSGAIKLADNKTLRSLDIGANQIGDDGAIAFSGNETLHSLGMIGCQVANNGAIALAGNKALKDLRLRHNRIGDIGMIALAGSTTLKSLWMGGNCNGVDGAEAFGKPYIERIRRAKELGVKTEIFSLRQFCFLAIRKTGQARTSVDVLKNAGMPEKSGFFQRYLTEEGDLSDEVPFNNIP